MDITTLKQQARVLEQKGDTAGALEAFHGIIAQLVKSGIEPEGPLFVKAGDLTLKTGNRQGAVAMFERAAARYASMGSAKSVIALCLKILRTDPLHKDVHVRYARQLFGRGHVEPARLVLLDYAERSQLHKTHQTLGRLANRSVPEITVKLQEFFDTVDRGVRMTGERRAMSAPPFSARRSETAEHLAVMADAIMRKDPAVPASPSETAPFTVDRPEEQPPAAPDPVMTELKRSASPTPAPQRTTAAAKPAVQAGTPAARTRRFRLPNLLKWDWRTRPARMWPVVAAAAVLILGIGLMAAGAVPFGGDLDAEQPPVPSLDGRAKAVTLMTAATLDSLWFTDEPDTVAMTVPDGPQVADPEVAPESKPAPRARPRRLDQRVLAAASETVLDIDAGAMEVELDNSILDAGRIEVPTDVPMTFTEPARPEPAARPAAEPVIAIRGLEIVAVARGSASYRVVQRLQSGDRVTLTVVSFDEAPAGHNGQLRVAEAPGDSAVGTRRFRESYVTAEGPIGTATMRQLLSRLSLQGGQ